MSDDTARSVQMTRLEKGRYDVVNPRGGRMVIGHGGDDDSFTPVELLLAAIAGCGAADVDFITSKRAEPVRFDVRVSGDKIRDELGNRLTDLVVTFDVAFADDDAGRAASEVLPSAVQTSHDRLCTVSRTVEVGTPVATRIA
jgi:putative redox protein